jgi:hypothetical protein
MKKNKRIFQNITLLAIVAFLVIACDKDYADIGSGIIGSDNFSTDSESFNVIAYNHRLDPVRGNALSTYLLGIYNDDNYGTTTASIVGQMAAESYDPIFDDNVEITSVYLNIPFFSNQTEIDEDGNAIYELDSIFGSIDTKIKLDVYQNNYFLRNFDPNSEFDDALEYYTDKTTSDGGLINETSDLMGTPLYSKEIKPDASQIIVTEIDDDGEEVEVSRLSPAIRIPLLYDNTGSDNDQNENYNENYNDVIPENYWEDLIIAKEGEPELSNANNFMNYFRGLYIKASLAENQSQPNGNMAILNLSAASLTINFKNDSGDDDNDGILNYIDADIDGDGITDNGPDTDNDGIKDDYDADVDGDGTNDNGVDEDNNGIMDNLVANGSFVMNFTGNIVNLIDYNSTIIIPTPDNVNGDEKLYLKGGSNGNMAILNLFNGDDEGNSTELDEFKAKNWLINEANIVFHVDETALLNDEPERIYLYDLKNNTPLVDYFLDRSTDPDNGATKISHLEPLVRVDDDPNGEGIRYKVRITEHINNIFLRDSTNVKIGLAISNNVTAIDNLIVKDYDEANDGILPKTIVNGSFLSPKGTILYGNNLMDETKKVKLEIFYTEPN